MAPTNHRPAPRPGSNLTPGEPHRFAYDGAFWRRLAWLGASRGPGWWVRYSPPAFGLAAAIAVPEARRAVAGNLRRARGPVGSVRQALDVARTFVGYAGCLAEVLSNGSKNAAVPELIVHGERNLVVAKARKRGIVMVTAHTAGWELTGPQLLRDHGLDMLMVMEPERSPEARKLHDEARRASGLEVAHVGRDPLAGLPLLAQLRRGGIVAAQIDRMPEGMRGRAVTLFDAPGEVPEGPMRLAQISGAPLLPAFCARMGFRRYRVILGEPIFLPRRPTEAELDDAAQRMADAMTSFLRRYPTQWFDFGQGQE